MVTVATVALSLVASIPDSNPASADTVIGGCTIVSNPTPTDFTDCPGTNFSTANLSGVDLSYADLSNAIFASCPNGPFPPGCSGTQLSNADLDKADISDAVFGILYPPEPPFTLPYGAEATLSDATLSAVDATGANFEYVDLSGDDLAHSILSNADLYSTNLSNSNLSDTNLSGAYIETTVSGANLTNANLTGGNVQSSDFTDAVLKGADFAGAFLQGDDFGGTILVPPNQTAPAPNSSGAMVSWPTPKSLRGATPGTCSPASGSTFPVGTTEVSCKVNGDTIAGDPDNVAEGDFQVVVTAPVAITTTSLPPATIGVAYSAQLAANGGNPPCTWKLISGSLPKGLKLDGSAGAISGTPSKHSATSNFTVEVLDTKTTTKPRTRNTAEAAFTISVSS
jgi:uncharacterized protein YjbI with pentapeptide repeats